MPQTLRLFTILSGITLGSLYSTGGVAGEPIHLRVNQLGFLANDLKSAIAFSEVELDPVFIVADAESGEVVFRGETEPAVKNNWNAFNHHARLDFTRFRITGRYVIRLEPSGVVSTEFRIGDGAFATHVEDLLGFMRQQRCGRLSAAMYSACVPGKSPSPPAQP